MRHLLALAVALLAPAMLPAQTAERTPAAVLPAIKHGTRLRIEAGNALMTGRLDSLSADQLRILGADGRSSIPIRTITTLWVREGRSAKGALIGGVIGAVVFTGLLHYIISAFCDSSEGCAGDHRRAWGYGISLGGAGGALIGAGVGALVGGWEQKAP